MFPFLAMGIHISTAVHSLMYLAYSMDTLSNLLCYLLLTQQQFTPTVTHHHSQ